MIGATTSNMDANTNETTGQVSSLLPSTSYSCSSCKITFENGQEQRAHMKEPWHVNNLKRRLESLPPVSLNEFNVQSEKTVDIKGKKVTVRDKSLRANVVDAGNSGDVGDDDEDDDEILDDEDEQYASPFQCLFCNQDFTDEDDGLEMNLEHMHTAHGLSIPSPEAMADMQSFVGYLATEVRLWHECLYCGATKDSTLSIQSHMKDKGHCHLNLDREPELLEFWDSPPTVDGQGDPSDQERPTHLSETEIRFASGKIIESRRAALATKKASRKRDTAASTALELAPDSNNASADADSSSLVAASQLASGRQLSRREEMGMVGVSLQQRQALVLAEKKAQRSEMVARRAREWVYARAANTQEHDQIDGKMKAGKQNHKLQPR